MASEDRQQLFSRILLGAVVLVLAGGMLLYLVPSMPGNGSDAATSTDTVATVGSESVSMLDVRQQLAEIEQRNQVPKALESLYAQQILKQLVFQKEIEFEAKRLGVHVSDEERAERIRQFLPTAYDGGNFVGMDRYAAEVQARFQMTVPVFEEQIRQGLLLEKFRKLVTDGISVGPAELKDEFLYRNEKIKLDYVLIKPEDLAAKINPERSGNQSLLREEQGQVCGAREAHRALCTGGCEPDPAADAGLRRRIEGRSIKPTSSSIKCRTAFTSITSC